MGTAGLGYLTDLFAAAVWGGLTIYFIRVLRIGLSGRAMLLLSTSGWLWFVSGAVDAPALVQKALELLTLSFVMGFGLRVLGLSFSNFRSAEYLVQRRLALVVAALIGTAGVLAVLDARYPSPSLTLTANVVALLIAVSGLVILEQIVRNTRRDYAWNMKFLGIGLALMFVYDFAMQADAVLFNRVDPEMEALRSIAYALAAPLLMLVADRNATHSMSFSLSRRFVFHSGVLLLTGTYLLLMTVAAYYLRLFGGDWGQILQTLFLIVALVAGATVATSRSLREQFRAVLNRNLFEARYDYREEWTRITNALSSGDGDGSLEQRAIHCISDAIQSPGGALWTRTPADSLVCAGRLMTGWRDPVPPEVAARLIAFFEMRPWVIDLEEYASGAPQYADLGRIDAWIEGLDGARFVVPLMIDDRLFGVVGVRQPLVDVEYATEDFDLMRLAGRQVASFLSQQYASETLSRDREFQAFSQMSAFVIHDIKTVVSQLSLLTTNAERHRDNPEFIDDMIATTAHAVQRMQKLINHLRPSEAAEPGRQRAIVQLEAVVRSAMAELAGGQPVPRIESCGQPLPVSAEEDTLKNIIGHIVRNAQEATPADGKLTLSLDRQAGWARLMVTDSGAGMSETFLRNDLFKPFASTKGLTGMGVGAYQSREYLRSLGGDLTVTSREGHGTEFILSIPLAEASVQEHTAPPAESAA